MADKQKVAAVETSMHREQAQEMDVFAKRGLSTNKRVATNSRRFHHPISSYWLLLMAHRRFSTLTNSQNNIHFV